MSTTTVSKDALARLAEQLNWTTPETERSLQAAIKDVTHRLGGDKLRRALHGDWLNEPLHAILTDIPVGAWSATVAFDAVASIAGESELATQMDHAADAALVLGLLGAVGAAVTGIHDWSEIEKPAARKIGLVHAALNVAAIGLFAASGFHRIRKERTLARFLAGFGYLAVSVSAHLGGNLVYEHGIGVQPAGDATSTTDSLHG